MADIEAPLNILHSLKHDNKKIFRYVVFEPNFAERTYKKIIRNYWAKACEMN